ncbi:MAG: DUF192 domain-containing protein [Algicola sp.]|nr:DUF192 domain-containing protein [Algicola sp.]
MHKLLKNHVAPALLVSAVSLSSIACKEDKAPAIKPTKISFKKEGELTILKAKTDSVLAHLDIEIAKTSYETQTGLMYRNTLKPNHGMLFIFEDVSPRYFYMKNTLIPLDIIYLDDKQVVVSIQKNAKPLDESSLPSKVPAKYVLEVNAGLSETWQLSQGDRIKFTESSN